MKVGILGFGTMGKIRKKCIDSTKNWEVKKIYDLNLQDIPENLISESAYDILNDASINVIFICTPNKYNFEYTKTSLINGKDVFCEKPPAFTSDEVLEIKNIESYTGKKLMYGFNHRHHQSIQLMKMNERSASKPTMVLDAVVEVNPFESDNTIAQLDVSNGWESNLSAEIQVISDDEYINSLNLRRTSSEGPNNPSDKVENPVILVTLRTFDLLFFVLEKAITIGLPSMLAFGDRVKLVLENVESNGMGRRGWQMLRNLKDSKCAVDK
jgi:hypothetical protein